MQRPAGAGPRARRWPTSTPACSRPRRRCSARSSQTSTLDETLLARRAASAPARRSLAREEHSLGAVPAAQGRRPGAVGVGHRDLPQLPAALQVRARPAHPHRADAPPALRDRRAPGARALPLRRRRRRSTQMLELLDAGWRRSAASATASASASCTRRRATRSTRYHARLHEQRAEPVWFERSFSFRLGPHHLRGRVDRVDRLGRGRRRGATS